VSRLFPDRLLIRLAPSGASYVRTAAGPRRRVVEQGSVPASALASIPVPRRCDVTVILSNHFVRYALVPWSDSLGSEAEEEAYVRHHFAKIHGERAKRWVLRSSEAPRGASRLASAVDPELLASVRQGFPEEGRARLISVQPYLMTVLNRWRRAIPRGGAWLAVAEPERACVALHDGATLRAVQNARGDWLPLLERERHRLEGELPDLVLVMGESAPADGAGWRFRELSNGESQSALAA
jgi:hypothetical protein